MDPLSLRIALGCDMAAYDFKISVLNKLHHLGYQIEDLGCNSREEGEYPQIAEKVAKRVVSGEFERGLLICGTGQGMVMAANKISGARAALCYDILPALMSREHNNANILCCGAWLISEERYISMVKAWLFAKFSSGVPHIERINYMLSLEEKRTYT
jgi:ribose 5-phosphate isomerase B